MRPWQCTWKIYSTDTHTHAAHCKSGERCDAPKLAKSLFHIKLLRRKWVEGKKKRFFREKLSGHGNTSKIASLSLTLVVTVSSSTFFSASRLLPYRHPSRPMTTASRPSENVKNYLQYLTSNIFLALQYLSQSFEAKKEDDIPKALESFFWKL